MSADYTASDIKVLEGLEAVRKRPAMYIGDTGAYGLHHLVYEEVEIRRGGKVWTQRYEKGGVPTGPLTAGEATKKQGTIVKFKPDATIFETTEFSFDTLSNRLRELAFLNKGLKIVIEDERDGRSHTFLYKGGIIEFVKHLNQNKTPIHPKVMFFEGKKGDIECEVALQYNDGYQESVFSFANNINTREGGTHLTGFRSEERRVGKEW